MTLIDDLSEKVLYGNAKETTELVTQALSAGIAAEIILNDGLIAPMQRVGQLFEQGEFFVPEMMIAARAMRAGLVLLRPHLVSSGVKPVGRVVIGTVEGDLHDIGKSLVSMMLEGSGFEIIDLGVNVLPETFVAAVRNGAEIVALSALLTTTMPNMKRTIDAIAAAGLREKVSIIIGGAPVTQTYADSIGADGYASDAAKATHLAKSLIGAA